MFKNPSHALVAALALMAAPAFAQETPAPEDAAPAETAEVQPEAEAPAAEAESDEPQLGQVYVKTTHGDWGLRCVRTEAEVDPCEMNQLLRDGNGNSVAEVTVIPLSNGEVVAGATLIAPLETDLMRGVSLAIDSAQARTYPFGLCTQMGCVSRIGFSASDLAQWKRGNQANVTLMPFGGDPNNPVRLSLSLSGFTAAFDEVAAMAAQAQAQ